MDDLFADLPPMDPYAVKKIQMGVKVAVMIHNAGKQRSNLEAELGWPAGRLTSIIDGECEQPFEHICRLAFHLGMDVDIGFTPSASRVAVS